MSQGLVRAAGAVIKKPWGEERFFDLGGARYGLKKLWIRRGHCLSLQRHRFKDETILVESGIVLVEARFSDNSEDVSEVAIACQGEAVRIPAGTVHRFIAYPYSDATLVEVSNGHPDSDIVRYEVDGRTLGGPLPTEDIVRMFARASRDEWRSVYEEAGIPWE